jgi:hypothetical protein
MPFVHEIRMGNMLSDVGSLTLLASNNAAWNKRRDCTASFHADLTLSNLGRERHLYDVVTEWES